MNMNTQHGRTIDLYYGKALLDTDDLLTKLWESVETEQDFDEGDWGAADA